MADMESVTLTVNECKGTLENASKTIRTLIKERNAALAATDPAVVATMKQETDTAATALSLRADLEAARKDTEAAIAEATGIPAVPAKSSPAQYPKTLSDSTEQHRDNVIVDNARNESAARAAGFTIQVLPQPTTTA